MFRMVLSVRQCSFQNASSASSSPPPGGTVASRRISSTTWSVSSTRSRSNSSSANPAAHRLSTSRYRSCRLPFTASPCSTALTAPRNLSHVSSLCARDSGGGCVISQITSLTREALVEEAETGRANANKAEPCPFDEEEEEEEEEVEFIRCFFGGAFVLLRSGTLFGCIPPKIQPRSPLSLLCVCFSTLFRLGLFLSACKMSSKKLGMEDREIWLARLDSSFFSLSLSLSRTCGLRDCL